MKKVLASLLVLGFCVFAVSVEAGLPPKTLPGVIPSSAFPSLIGTWNGKMSMADAVGVRTVNVTLKITQQSQRRFRGWMTQGTSTTEVLFVGVAGPGNQVLIKVKAAGDIPALVAHGEMDWSTNNAAMDLRSYSLDDNAAAGHILLIKTTP